MDDVQHKLDWFLRVSQTDQAVPTLDWFINCIAAYVYKKTDKSEITTSSVLGPNTFFVVFEAISIIIHNCIFSFLSCALPSKLQQELTQWLMNFWLNWLDGGIVNSLHDTVGTIKVRRLGILVVFHITQRN